VSKSVRRFVFLIVLVSVFGLFWMIQPGSGNAAQDPQSGGAPPPPPAGGGWGGGRLRLLGIEAGLENKVVTGAPYSAQAVTERTQVLANGNEIDQKSTATVYRDGQGRTRREMTMGPIGPWAGPKNASPMIVINDPVAGVGYLLNPSKQTAVTHPLGALKGFHRKAQNRRARLQQADANASTESLGNKMIAGVEAEGTRTTVTIPAGQIGNAQPIQIVTEKWYSPALQVTLMVTRSDPRSGTTTYQLTSVNQTEPDPELFKVPSNYTTQERPAFRHGPPPPPPDAN
jgi:hypothetical protein